MSQVDSGPLTGSLHFALEQMYRQSLGFIPPKAPCPLLSFKVFPKNARESTSQAGRRGNIYKKNAGIALFFVLLRSRGILRCSKGIAEGGPGYSRESKRLCGL